MTYGPVDVARTVRDFVETHGPEDMPMVRQMIRESGIEPGVHVGVAPEAFDDRMKAEWWLGQLADMIDEQAWWAINTLQHLGQEFG